jgi:hypothetical protein
LKTTGFIALRESQSNFLHTAIAYRKRLSEL